MVAKLFVPPKHPICCHHFASMQSKLIAPFRATFHGTFVDVGELDMSQQGQTKRYFSFVDDSGAWMKGCALGAHAQNAKVLDGVDAVLYFCTGRGPIGTQEGMINLNKDAVIVPVAQHEVATAKRMFVSITEA